MKILIVCSHGGHLTEMDYISSAFANCEVVYVTYDSKRTRSLKNRTYLFENFGKNVGRMLLNIPKFINILLSEEPDVIISNGAEIAIPFFLLGWLLGIRTIFIETFTRITDPTWTGKIVYSFSTLFLVLWPEMLNAYGKRAKYYGSLLEPKNQSFESARWDNRIFVIVGMHNQGFSRLVMKMDDLARNRHYKVIMQIGNTEYTPRNATFFDFKDKDEEIRELMRTSAIVVCQGAMTIVDALNEGATVISVPRLQRYEEHLNDHQLYFANRLKELTRIDVIEEIDDLDSTIARRIIEHDRGEKVILIPNIKLIDSIRKYLDGN